MKNATIRRFLARLNKPELFFQPKRLLQRLVSFVSPAKSLRDVHTITSWGAHVTVSPNDAIGRSILAFGVYDLVVSEVLWRLAEPGRLCVDVGANIGYTLLLLATRNCGGCVIGFEPHPELFSRLSRHIDVWREHQDSKKSPCRVVLHQKALGARRAFGTLAEPEDFSTNIGRAHLVGIDDEKVISRARSYQVLVDRLDQIISPAEKIWILKIDVEGNELDVLTGADNLLGAGSVRHIVYEDEQTHSTHVRDCLTEAGYTIWRLEKQFKGPAITQVNANIPKGVQWEPASFLATLEPDLVLQRLQPLGWRCLKRKARDQ